MINEPVKLQVLVSTFGSEGATRMATHNFPPVAGVEYIVAWQLPDGDAEIPTSLKRPDIRFVKTSTRGLSMNRNIALSAATAPFLLIADDDIDYTEQGLRNVIEAFETNPDADILTFRYASEEAPKPYPTHTFEWKQAPRNCYISSIEIGMRRESILRSGIRFDERFGIGGRFIAGEEDVLMTDAHRAHLTARYLPITICTHAGATTTERHRHDQALIRTKGAVMAHIHPLTWPLRLITHLRRHTHDNHAPNSTSDSNHSQTTASAPSGPNHASSTPFGSNRLSATQYALAWLRGAHEYYRHPRQ